MLILLLIYAGYGIGQMMSMATLIFGRSIYFWFNDFSFLDDDLLVFVLRSARRLFHCMVWRQLVHLAGYCQEYSLLPEPILQEVCRGVYVDNALMMPVSWRYLVLISPISCFFVLFVGSRSSWQKYTCHILSDNRYCVSGSIWLVYLVRGQHL